MALDATLPKDPVAAQQLLEALILKDQKEELCRYPTCRDPRKAPPEKGGKPPVYCENPRHTPQSNMRARTYIENLAKGLPTVTLETEQPLTSLTVQSLRDNALSGLERFSEHLGLYVTALKEFSDPDIAAAQIEAAQHRADAQIAAAQEMVETERSLRLSAEHSRDTAQKDAQAARAEASLAISKLQETEERAKHQQEEYEGRIAQLQREHEEAVEAIRAEAERQIADVKQQASRDIAQAQKATSEAQKEARSAEARAHDAETEARIAVTSAEQRVTEAYATLSREQEEVIRLRQERDTRAEADHREIEQLRADLSAARTSARTREEDDRAEIQQLRANLLNVTKRADDLAHANDTLRAQLLQLQMQSQEKQEKSEGNDSAPS